MLQNKNNNCKSFDEFIKEYKKLKKEEKYNEIITLGRELLNLNIPSDLKLDNLESAKIRLILSSNHYYLGQYQESLKCAESALSEVQNLENANLIAKALYLSSAVHRALAQKNVTEKEKHSILAKDYIDRALNTITQVDEFISAKIHFNAGALQQDVYSNNHAAAEHFIEALNIYQKCDSQDDVNRTKIRYIRTLWDANQIDSAIEVINSMKVDPQSKTGVQFALLKTKFYLSLGNTENMNTKKIITIASEALIIAQEKGMIFESKNLYRYIFLSHLQIAVSEAKKSLEKNSDNEISLAISAQIDQIFTLLVKNGFSEHNGLDNELRPPYVIVQGLIEQALNNAKLAGHIDEVQAFIVTPRMPTPLMLESGNSLDKINLKEPSSYAEFRHNILKYMLASNINLHAIYSINARNMLADQKIGLINYDSLCKKHQNLKDFPILKIKMEELPPEIQGALYKMGKQYISIESKQLPITQINNKKPYTWSIKLDVNAESRAQYIRQEINKISSKTVSL